MYYFLQRFEGRIQFFLIQQSIKLFLILTIINISSYKQRKFNLFREESEGFAKLVTELNKDFNENTTYKHLLDIVQSLIGNAICQSKSKNWDY